MLIRDMREMGNKLFGVRKKAGLTQAEVAEKAGLSDRTYADIERGTSNMRAETLVSICTALNITPDDIFVNNNASPQFRTEEILDRLNQCSERERETALSLLDIYLKSLNR